MRKVLASVVAAVALATPALAADMVTKAKPIVAPPPSPWDFAFGSGGNFQGGSLPNGNVIKANVSFWEVYGKATYTVNDNFSFGGSVYYSPSVLNSGANGTYVAGTAKVVFPTTMLPPGLGVYAS